MAHRKLKFYPIHPEVTSNDILNYLRLETRICVLDGFLGNYNEMELISILRSIKRQNNLHYVQLRTNNGIPPPRNSLVF